MGNAEHNGPDFKVILSDQAEVDETTSTTNDVAVDVCESSAHKTKKDLSGLKIRMPKDLCDYIKHVALSKGTSANALVLPLLKEHFKGYKGFVPPDYGY